MNVAGTRALVEPPFGWLDFFCDEWGAFLPAVVELVEPLPAAVDVEDAAAELGVELEDVLVVDECLEPPQP